MNVSMIEQLTSPSDSRVALLEAENARLRAALLPFAEHAKDWEAVGASMDDPLVEGWAEGPYELPLTVGHLIAARIAIEI